MADGEGDRARLFGWGGGLGELIEGGNTYPSILICILKCRKEIAYSPKDVAKYAEVLEGCVLRGSEADEFVARCRDEGLTIAATDEHISLYRELVRLENDPKGSKNGIWARIIKNSFAPLFEGRESFDFVAGNPPWVNWEALPKEYRSASQPIWEHYGLTGGIPLKKRQASDKAKTDISILMTYLCTDVYLRRGGSLGFVITRTVFQSEIGGWHFRSFSLPGKIQLKVIRVDDLDRLKPFRGRAANVTGYEPTASVSAALDRLTSAELEKSFVSARAYLEQRTRLWDWDEEVDLVGVAKIAFLPLDA